VESIRVEGTKAGTNWNWNRNANYKPVYYKDDKPIVEPVNQDI